MDVETRNRIDRKSVGLRWRFLLWIPLAGIIQFLICFWIACELYPGGSPLNQGLDDGYRFWENPISDLGRYFAWNGKPNISAAQIYVPSLIVLSILILPLCIFMDQLVERGRRAFSIAAFFLALSAGAMIGVALTPYDQFFPDHDWFFTRWLIAFIALLLISLIGFTISSVAGGFRRSDVFFAFATLMVLVFFVIQVCIPAFGGGLELVVANQKIIAFGCIAWLAMICLRLIYVQHCPTVRLRGLIPAIVATLSGAAISGALVHDRISDNQFQQLTVYPGSPMVIMFDFPSISAGSVETNSPLKQPVCYLNGIIEEGEEILIELWSVDSGERRRVDEHVVGHGRNVFPLGNDHLVSSLQIYIAPRDSIAPDSNEADERDIVLHYPDDEFRAKVVWSFGTGLVLSQRNMVYFQGSTNYVPSADSFEELGSDPELQALALTVTRLPP